MHSHLGHSQQQVGRGSLPPHANPLHRCLHNPVLGPLLGSSTVELVEFHSQKLLYMVFYLHNNSDDKDLRADTGEGKGMEAGWICHRRLPRPCAYCYAHLQGLVRIGTF